MQFKTKDYLSYEEKYLVLLKVYPDKFDQIVEPFDEIDLSNFFA